jgi:hypothetical protein
MHGYEHTANAEELGSNTKPQIVEKFKVSQQNTWKDLIAVTIPARGEKEYKLLLAKGEAFAYSWESDKGELFFDFHGEPKGDTTGSFESFDKNTSPQSSGAIVTTFEGTHGWHWKNNNLFPVNITLKVKGDYQRLDVGLDTPQIEPTKAPDKPTHESID